MAKITIFVFVVILLVGCAQTGIQITGNIAKQKVLRQTGNLAEVFHQNDISAEYALVIAADGTAFFISEKSFPEIDLIVEDGKINSSSASLPPVCNLNNIKEICLYNSNFPLTHHQTSFSLRISDFEFLGQSARNDHFVRKYKLKENRK